MLALAKKYIVTVHSICNIVMQNIAQDIASNGKNDQNRHINDQAMELYTKKVQKA